MRIGGCIVAYADHRGVVVRNTDKTGLVARPQAVMPDGAHAAVHRDAQTARIGVGSAIVERRERGECLSERRTADARRPDIRMPERKVGDR